MNCDCIERVNEKLRHEFGTRLATTILIGKDISETLSISTVRLEESRAPRRKKPTPILVSFCPFCGAKATKAEDKG